MARLISLTRFAPLVAASLLLAAGLVMLDADLRPGQPFAGGVLRVDALSAYFLVLVGAVGLTVTWAGTVGSDDDSDPRYAGWLLLFLAAMTLTLLADNLGVMWVGIEGTTIATAFLVGHRGDRRAVEAAWKYVVLGSVGIAIALFGLVLLYAATAAGGEPTLSWVALMAAPDSLDPRLARLALALAVLGLATKAGLAPMHAWLPDAHSQAPAPVSGLMSGVLLSVAFYGILRLQAVSDAVAGPALMRVLLIGGGLLSLVVATALMVGQRDLKRLLAYSSTEHLGIVAIGAGIGGPLAITAVLLHVLGHGLAKAVLFVSAGRVLKELGTTRISEVTGLLAQRPRLAWPMLVGMGTLLGLPPGALFFSEVAIVVAAWQRGLGWVSLVTAGLLVLVFAALARHTLSMTLGPAPRGPSSVRGAESPPTRVLPLALALVAAAVLALLPGLQPVLAQAVAALGVAP